MRVTYATLRQRGTVSARFVAVGTCSMYVRNLPVRFLDKNIKHSRGQALGCHPVATRAVALVRIHKGDMLVVVEDDLGHGWIVDGGNLDRQDFIAGSALRECGGKHEKQESTAAAACALEGVGGHSLSSIDGNSVGMSEG